MLRTPTASHGAGIEVESFYTRQIHVFVVPTRGVLFTILTTRIIPMVQAVIFEYALYIYTYWPELYHNQPMSDFTMKYRLPNFAALLSVITTAPDLHITVHPLVNTPSIRPVLTNCCSGNKWVGSCLHKVEELLADNGERWVFNCCCFTS